MSKFIIEKGQHVELTEGADGFYRDPSGTIFAYKDPSLTADQADRCGVAPLALPQVPFFKVVNQACSPHDFMYSSAVYQAFHTREEADAHLEQLQAIAGHPYIGMLFHFLAEELGERWWENPATR